MYTCALRFIPNHHCEVICDVEYLSLIICSVPGGRRRLPGSFAGLCHSRSSSITEPLHEEISIVFAVLYGTNS